MLKIARKNARITNMEKITIQPKKFTVTNKI